MRYKSGKDFRQTLETRLRNESIRTGAPAPPSSWAAPYRRIARETGLPFSTLQEGWEAARIFLQPVLTPTNRHI